MRVFVTGGTGLIGRRLAAALLEGGDSVAVLSRDAMRARDCLLEAVSVVEGDPTVPGAWQNALSEADAVVSLAGEPIFARRWTRAHKERMRTSRVRSTENVVAAMAGSASGPRTLISGSAIGYYGPRGDTELDEGSAAGSDFLARVGVEWEAAARKAEAEAAGARVVLLRTGVVLSGDGGALEQMMRPFRLHVGGRIGSGRQWISWIHIDDLVGIILWALRDERMAGPLNGTTPVPLTNAEFSRTLGGRWAARVGCPCRGLSCARRWAKWRALSSAASASCRGEHSRADTDFAILRPAGR